MSFLDPVNAWLVSLLGPFGPLMAVGVLGFLMVLLALPKALARRRDPLDRLRETQETRNAKDDKAQRLRRVEGKDKLERYSNFLEPQNAEEYSAVKLKLLQAGYRGKNAVRIYHFLQFALGIGCLVLGVGYTVYVTATSETPLTMMRMLLYTLLPGVLGYMAPKYWVKRRQEARKVAITNAFPDSLDMMLVCVEAGQSLDQSIVRVAQELKSGFPELAEEFAMVSHELKAGKDKTQVLRDLSERCGVSDISSFVTVLVQSQQFGTSIADALRVYSSEMRDKRVMRAEEKANTLPTKMTLATMMLTVPPLLIILIGPSIYEIAEVLGGGLDGVENGVEGD
jgi:tight adherence protein C